MDELKPCPFCGNKNISVITDSAEYSLGLTDSAYFNVVCSMNDCGCGASSGWYGNHEETVEAWNRRAEASEAWNRRAEDANKTKT